MSVDMEPTQLLVADLMTIDPVTVPVDASIEEAARLLHANSVTGLPVIDAFGALVGVISQTDLVAALDSPVGTSHSKQAERPARRRAHDLARRHRAADGYRA